MCDDAHVLQIQGCQDIVEICTKPAQPVSKVWLLRLAVAAHVISSDSIASSGKVRDLLLPFCCGLSPSRDEE